MHVCRKLARSDLSSALGPCSLRVVTVLRHSLAHACRCGLRNSTRSKLPLFMHVFVSSRSYLNALEASLAAYAYLRDPNLLDAMPLPF